MTSTRQHYLDVGRRGWLATRSPSTLVYFRLGFKAGGRACRELKWFRGPFSTGFYLAVIGFLALHWSCRAAEMQWRPEATWQRGKNPVLEMIETAMEHESMGRYNKAVKWFRKVEKNSINTHNKALAVLARARCLRRDQRPWPAYLEFRKAVDEYANFIPFVDVLQDEYDIANLYFDGQRDRFLFFSFSAVGKAIEIYDHIAIAGPNAPFAASAVYRSALLSLRGRDYEIAAEKFKQVIIKYSTHPMASEARIELTRCCLAEADYVHGDGTLIAQARYHLDTFMKQYPGHSRTQEAVELADRAKEIEARRLLHLGRFYLRDSHQRVDASKRYLQEVLEQYPDTISAVYAEELSSVVRTVFDDRKN